MNQASLPPQAAAAAAATQSGAGYQGSRNTNSVLWMGDIEPEMDEMFIEESFKLLNLSTTYVKVIRDRESGTPQGYGFVGFDSEETAKRALEQHNGSAIPNSTTGRKFKLNVAGKNHYQSNYRARRSFNPQGSGSPSHQGYANASDHRPKNYYNPSSHHHHNQSSYGQYSGQMLPTGPPSAPVLSSALYPTLTSATAAAPVILSTVQSTVPLLPSTANNSSPLSSLSTGPSPGPNGTTVNVAGSSSGNSSGPVSGGSSAGGNTPVPSSTSTLRVDNWNPEPIGGGHSNRSSQEHVGGGQEPSVAGRATEYTAFIGSLDYKITSEDLESKFKERYPSVVSGKVILEEATGQSKGFGFVRFSSHAEYKAALNECADAPMFGGRGIRISAAHPKPPRSHYAGSVNSGDSSYYRQPRVPYGRGSDIGVSNGGAGLIHGSKHGGGKGAPRGSTSDNPDFDQQKIQARMNAIREVRNWYPTGGNNGQGGNQVTGGHSMQSPRNPAQNIINGMAGMDLNGAPIILPPDNCGGYQYWQSAAAAPTYGQAIPTGYPSMDQYSAAAGQPTYWTGTGPNGQPLIWATDPTQVYAGIDYSTMTGGQVPTPYPRIPYTEQTAHMFAPQAMMHAAAAAAQHQLNASIPTVNNGMGQQHHHQYMAGAGDVVPGGPTPPSDPEHSMIAISNNGWVGQN